VQMTVALAMTVMMTGLVLESVSALPMRYYRTRPFVAQSPLTIHSPVSGAQIALTRGIPLRQFVHSGLQSVGDYAYFDDVAAAGDPGYPYRQNSHVVVLNKPKLDNVNIGAHVRPGFY
ncbi:unnamed protein product, partial [Candidula unifasciata]